MCDNLKKYQICIFPDERINHFENITPFIIVEDNIFQRKINFNLNKPGLGTTPDEVESPYKRKKVRTEPRLRSLD